MDIMGLIARAEEGRQAPASIETHCGGGRHSRSHSGGAKTKRQGWALGRILGPVRPRNDELLGRPLLPGFGPRHVDGSVGHAPADAPVSKGAAHSEATSGSALREA